MPEFDRKRDRGAFEAFEREALVPVYEEALRGDPDDLQVLAYLGAAYTKLGRHEEALEMDRRLAALAPRDPVVRYNLACSYALLGRIDEAFRELDRAVELGYRDRSHLERDEDLANLRCDPRFAALLDQLSDL